MKKLFLLTVFFTSFTALGDEAVSKENGWSCSVNCCRQYGGPVAQGHGYDLIVSDAYIKAKNECADRDLYICTGTTMSNSCMKN